MKHFTALFAAFLFLTPLFATAQIIGFEELHPGYETSQIEIPNGYKGFDWSDDFLGMTSGYLPGTGYANGVTGTMLAYTWYHRPVWMRTTDGSLFDFIKADLTAGRLDNETVTVEGWRNGTVIYTEQVVTSTDGPYSFLFNFFDVDKVKIIPNQAAGDHHLAIDQIEIASLETVPEPATMLLLAVGGIVLFQLQSSRRLKHRHC